MARSWGAQNFTLTDLNFSRANTFTLEGACAILPAAVKQAFYGAAIRQGVLRRGTWNGCAFNAGGIEIGLDPKAVQSMQAAAQAFQIRELHVKRFIAAWDGSRNRWSTDEMATKALIGILETIGLFTEPDRPKVRIIREVLYDGHKSDEQLIEDFKKELANPEFSFPELAMVELALV